MDKINNSLLRLMWFGIDRMKKKFCTYCTLNLNNTHSCFRTNLINFFDPPQMLTPLIYKMNIIIYKEYKN